MTTVVLVPLYSVLEDLKRRCIEFGLTVTKWSGPNTTKTDILLATYENSGTKPFIDVMRRWEGQQTLGRIVVDECQYPVYNLAWRPKIQAISQIQFMGVPKLYLSGSLSPSVLPKFF